MVSTRVAASSGMGTRELIASSKECPLASLHKYLDDRKGYAEQEP